SAAAVRPSLLSEVARRGIVPQPGDVVAAGPTWCSRGAARGVSTAGVSLACEFAELAGGFWSLLSDTTEPLLQAAPDNATNSATATINLVCVCVLLSICATVLYY